MGNQEVKIPPQNLEAEKSVLGSMLIDEEAIGLAIEVLDAGWFYEEAHRKIYKAIEELYQSRKNVDLITLSDKLKSDGCLEQVGGVTYLSSMIDFVPSSANAEHYAHIVKEKGILRRLIKNSTQIIGECFEAKGDIEDVVDHAEQLIFEIADLKHKQQMVPIKELIKEGIETIDRLYQRKEHLTGVPTGFHEIDKMTSGLQNSDLIIVAARPSMGKTAMAVTLAQNYAIEHGGKVALFSLEMSKEQLVQRMLCSHARVDAHKVRSGFLSPADWPMLTKAAGELSNAHIFIDDTPAISALELRAKARTFERSS